MKLKNVLIVVKDIEKSRKFYHDLFDIDLVLAADEAKSPPKPLFRSVTPT